MTVHNLFRAEGCSCNDTAKLRALLEGLPEPLCELHESDAIAARDAAAAQAQAEKDKAVIRQALRDVAPPAPSPPSFALNDDRSIRQVLAEALCAPVTEADPTTPIDAA
jgi:hypothetical protein